MKPITAGQIGELIKILAGTVSRSDLQEMLEFPEEICEFFKTGISEVHPSNMPLTWEYACRFFPRIILLGAQEVNRFFRTSLKLSDCPIGFTKKQLKSFMMRAEADFKIKRSKELPIALILLTNKDADGKMINLLYLKEKFGKSIPQDFIVDSLKADSLFLPVRTMWVLTYTNTNPVFLNMDIQEQRLLAGERNEEILTVAEDAYCQLMLATFFGYKGRHETPASIGSEEDKLSINNCYPNFRRDHLGLATALISLIPS